MNELHKARSIEITGALRKRALAAFARQIRTWKLAMPPVRPLVSDFGLGDFQRVGLIEYWVANEVEAGYCGKYLFVFDGQTCPEHRHRGKLETFFIVRGRVRMKYGKSVRIMKPGDVLRVERWHPHSFTGLGPALLLEVSTPCIVSDNYFQDARIPIGGKLRR